MYDLLIRGADVLQIDGETARVLPGHDIAIRDGRIAAVAPAISPGLADDLINAGGMLALPGLVNAHTHAAMGLFRGVAEDVPIDVWFNQRIWPMETNLTDEDIYWGTLLGIAEMIEAGVTCFADHYFAMDEVARAVDESGVRALLAWAVFSGPDEERQLQRTLAFAERWQGAADGRIRTCLGPHSPYTCTPAFLARVAQAARAASLGIHIHLSETAEQVAQSLAIHGKTPVALVRDAGLFAVPSLAAHVAHPTADDSAIMAAHGVAVAACPKTEMKLGVGVTPVVDLMRAGVDVGMGSDGAASNNSYDILEAARLIALLEKHSRRDATVLPVGAALSLATSGGARCLGLGGAVGALREGLQADIALLRLDSPHMQPSHDIPAALLYSACPSDADTVIVAGRVLMRGRQLLTIDKDRVLREVIARAGRLTQRRAGEQMATYPAAE
ncbi:amidohydrolase [Chloroflexales bacterium ZM16-3]|nr:amidohydrolase [Chloroflexales bacterium ZM16-3]